MSSDKEYSEKAYSDSASVHSVEVPNDNVYLQLKTNSLRNNVLECDSLGFHYQVSTDISAPGRRATRSSFISKWISKTDEQIPLAEWKRYGLGFLSFVTINNCKTGHWLGKIPLNYPENLPLEGHHPQILCPCRIFWIDKSYLLSWRAARSCA